NSGKTVEESLAKIINTTGQPINLYVDATNGSDDNEGTQDKPFKTINKAISKLPSVSIPSTTINIADGTYDETVHLYNLTHYYLNLFGTSKNTIITGRVDIASCPHVVLQDLSLNFKDRPLIVRESNVE